MKLKQQCINSHELLWVTVTIKQHDGSLSCLANSTASVT